VQPNVPQQQKWDRNYYRPILKQLEEATAPHLGKDIILWPESAVPNFYQRAQDFLEPITARAQRAGTALITGIPFRPEAGGDYYNSITALGYAEGVYHKQRLVPFGEYVPLESQLRGLIAFFDLPMSAFSAGPERQKPLRAGAYRVAPFICYEIVYGNLVAKNSRNTDIIVTISNDTWFGDSIGPLQHLQIAQMRGREVGRYVLRGTNNGVSAIIDHQGRIVKRTERFTQTTLVGEAQVMLGKTPFGSFGTTPIITACALSLLLMMLMYVGFWRDLD
jgi:apolipoprotein N-acyltransferase